MKMFITEGTGSSQSLVKTQNEKLPVFGTQQEAETALTSLAENQLLATSETAVLTNGVFTTGTTTLTGEALALNAVLKVMFTSAITGSDTNTAMSITYNGTSIPVKVAKNGSLIDFVANEINSAYYYLQAYIMLELLYDGTQFIIVGNPIVLSSSDYTIYADGNKLNTVGETITFCLGSWNVSAGTEDTKEIGTITKPGKYIVFASSLSQYARLWITANGIKITSTARQNASADINTMAVGYVNLTSPTKIYAVLTTTDNQGFNINNDENYHYAKFIRIG